MKKNRNYQKYFSPPAKILAGKVVKLRCFLLLEVDAFDAGGDGGEHLVGDSARGGSIALEEVAFAEEHHGVAFGTAGRSWCEDVGDIDEAHVHADAADDGHLHACDKHMALFVAEVTVPAVGIADGDNGYLGGPTGYPLSVVAHTLALGDVLDLRDAGHQTRHLPQLGLHVIIALREHPVGGDAVEAEAEAHHVHLCLGETRNARGVEDMMENLVAVVNGTVEAVAPSAEFVYLGMGEVVHVGVFTAGEVREDGAHLKGVGELVEAVGQGLDIVAGEAQTMHAGVELDMDGYALAMETHTLREELEDAEGINVGLEVVLYDVVEGGLLRVHHHDGEADAVAAQLDAFVGIGHGEVVDMIVLQSAGHLGLAGTIGRSLDHGHELGGRFDVRAVVVEVMYHGVEVDLHDGLMRLALEQFSHLLEAKHTGTLEEDGFVLEEIEVVVVEHALGALKEDSIDASEALLAVAEGRADGHEACDAALDDELCHLAVELMVGDARLEEVTDDKRLLNVLVLVLDKVEGDGEGVEVERVTVIDKQAVVDALVHLEAHLDRGEHSTTGSDGLGSVTQVEHQGNAMHDVLLRGTVDEGNGDGEGSG